MELNFNIDHKSDIPLHVQVENNLRELIKEPSYQLGKLLPNEAELGRMMGVSRTPLRQAINKLVFEELLVRKRRLGTKVASLKNRMKLSGLNSFSQEIQDSNMPLKNYELHVSRVKPDDFITDFFEAKTDTLILKLERLVGTTDGPSLYFTSYFNPGIALTGDEDFKLPLYEMLEQVHFIKPSISKEAICAIAAEQLVAEKLEVEPGSPVLFRKRLVFDQANRPIEFNLAYYKQYNNIYLAETWGN